MSSRLRNLIAVFCLSVAIWFGIIHGGLSLLAALKSTTIDSSQTASIRQMIRLSVVDLVRSSRKLPLRSRLRGSEMRVELKSQLIEAAEYDDASSRLRLYMSSGQIRDFSGVPDYIFSDLQAATSPGNYYMKLVREKYSRET